MTMKRICALLMLLALLCVGISALADDYGTAVISGGTSGKVHLREEPSFESDSMGLFFTGTPVKLLEEMGGDFTRVRIGVESGYMFTDYLRRGAAADKVKPQFWQGEITATNYANMRRGPSTEYQFLGRINEGRSVTIMGETRENWYYIEADGKEGYISARLVYTNGTPVSSPSNSAIYIQPDIPAAAYDDMHPAYAQVMLGQQPLFYAAHGSAAYIGNVGTCFDLGGEAQLAPLLAPHERRDFHPFSRLSADFHKIVCLRILDPAGNAAHAHPAPLALLAAKEIEARRSVLDAQDFLRLVVGCVIKDCLRVRP